MSGYLYPYNIFSVNIDETNLMQITSYSDTLGGCRPDLSPYEDKVVFIHTVGDPRIGIDATEVLIGDIYTMNTNGTNIQPILEDAYNYSCPIWGMVRNQTTSLSASPSIVMPRL